MSLTLWSAALSFSQFVEEAQGPGPSQNWELIYAQFNSIRTLSYTVNKALGSLVCWFLGNAILAYSMSLDALFVSLDWHKRVSLICNYLCAFGVLFTSADIPQQMESIKRWLKIDTNRKTVPIDQLNIILHEMTAKDIGIRGGDIFTITYTIVATVSKNYQFVTHVDKYILKSLNGTQITKLI